MNFMDVDLISFALDLFKKLRRGMRWLKSRKFRRVFGKDVNNEFHIIYCLYDAPRNDNHFPKPKSQIPARIRVSGGQNLEKVTSCASVKGVSYLVYGFGENVKMAPTISSDEDTDKNMDLSFISVGGITNFKTADLLRNPSNTFLDFNCKRKPIAIIKKNSRSVIVGAEKMGVYDYGLIIKIHPKGKRNRTWICCAGFGIWGTSGAAYYLANKWKKIHKWAGNKPFACVTRTEIKSDTSTDVIETLGGENTLMSKLISRCKNWR